MAKREDGIKRFVLSCPPIRLGGPYIFPLGLEIRGLIARLNFRLTSRRMSLIDFPKITLWESRLNSNLTTLHYEDGSREEVEFSSSWTFYIPVTRFMPTKLIIRQIRKEVKNYENL